MQAIERIIPQAIPRGSEYGTMRRRFEKLVTVAVELLALAGLCLCLTGLLSGLAVLSRQVL